jgi:5-methylcytosine-specific restriction endonuclease McrA
VVARSQGAEPGPAADASFAERLLELIDSGRRTATYKLALLMALLDLCARRADAAGSPPGVLFTREIAERVAAIYWPQVMPYRRKSETIQLRQITLPRSAITDAVLEFRRVAEAKGVTSLSLARLRLAREYSQMLVRVEVAVAEQPLPRLQIVGSGEQTLPFLYDIDWGPRESFSGRRLHRDNPAGLPVRLRPGAGDQLVRLAPLIRPLVELHWTRMVAAINKVATEEQDLHRHLFGRDRLTPPRALREGLADLQASRCFYCRRPFRRAPEADHFIPRVRCGIDAVENLVLADSTCNNDKRDLLPAAPLVDAWADRNLEHEDTLAQLASACGWDSDAPGTLAVARSIYRHLPPGPAAFWLGAGRVDITHVRPDIVIEVLPATRERS